MTELYQLIEELLSEPAKYFSNKEFYQDEIRERIDAMQDTRPATLELLLIALDDQYPTLRDDIRLLDRGRGLKEQFERLLDAEEPKLVVDPPHKKKKSQAENDEDLDKDDPEEEEEAPAPEPNVFTLERAKLLREKREVFDDLINLNQTLSVLIEKISKLSATNKDQSNPTKTTEVVADQPGAAQTMLKNRLGNHGKKIQRSQ